MARPIIPLLFALTAGIACGRLFPIPDTPVQLGLVFTVLLTSLSLIKTRRRMHYPSLLLSLFFIGILGMNISLYPHTGKHHIINYVGQDKIIVEGMLAETPQVSPYLTEMVLSSSRVLRGGEYLPVTGRVLLSMRGPLDFRYGDVIRVTTRLRVPRSFGNPGGFDYEKYLRFRGILVRGYVNDAQGVVLLRSERGNPVRAGLERFRDRVRNAILETAPDREGKIIAAMILGDQKAIPKETMEIFNRTGTTHIIAISGFNIGIVALFSLFVARLFLQSSELLLLRWNLTLISTIFSIIVVIFYTFVAGSGMSVVRASIMVVLFMVAILINRERDLYNTLALAAFVILIISPSSLFDISFQLSFAAVASLIFLMPRLTALLPPLPPTDSAVPMTKAWSYHLVKKSARSFVLFFFVSLTATLGTLPLILHYFNRLSVITLAANLLVVPILGIIAIPFCLLIVLAAPISSLLAAVVIRIAAWLVGVSLFILDKLAALPWSSITVATPTLLEISAFYLLLISVGFWLGALKRRRESAAEKRAVLIWRSLSVFLGLFFIVDGTLIHLRGLHQGRLAVTAVDVGQGSATLIRFPGGKRMLVDGGGFFEESFDVGKHVLAPFLWHEKINRIDTVVLTHPHPDHLQGLLFILDNFRVREVWTNGDESDSPLYRSFHRSIRDRGAILKILSEQSPDMDISGVKISILNPQGISDTVGTTAPFPSPQDEGPAGGGHPIRSPSSAKKRIHLSAELNDRSLVMRFTYGSRSFLLPGDISESTERRLAQSAADLRSDVLFVPHHGSQRSSTTPFLEKVQPEMAIVSCGTDNVFRLPHRETLARYESLQSQIYRTDRDGAVTVVTDGNALRTQTFRTGIPR